MMTRLRFRAAIAALVLLLARSTFACPVQDPSYTGACGPTFTLTGMSDLAAFGAPEYYATIQFADIDGDGAEELLARSIGGLWAFDFDAPDTGQWMRITRTDVLGNLLSDDQGWTDPSLYETIQSARLVADSQREQVAARGPNGIEIWDFTPGATPFTGSWATVPSVAAQRIFTGLDWSEPENYETIQFGDIDGDGVEEMIGRGPDGIDTYLYATEDGEFFQIGSAGAGMSDANGWNRPERYRTIQLVDLDADGAHELVARAQAGIKVWRWTFNSNQWVEVSVPAVLTDGDTWTQPQYYSTIQFANVSDFGDPGLAGRPEMLARSPSGVDQWIWTDSGFVLGFTDHRFSDSNGWTDPTNYETIQAADVDGDGFAEIVARADKEIVVERFDFETTTWHALGESSLLLDDDPWAQGAEYYTTIQAGDIDGVPGAELIGRGPYGLRTWRFDGAANAWKRYKDYGFGYGAGGAVDASSDTYAAINAYLDLPDPSDDLRSRYRGSNLSTLGLTLANYQQCLLLSLSDSDTPPTTCAVLGAVLPFDDRGVAKADWDAMANQLVSEIGSAIQTASLFEDELSVMGQLFENQNSEFPSLSEDIELAEFDGTKGDFDQLSLWSAILETASAAAKLTPEGATVSAGLNVASHALGALDIYDTTTPGQSKFEQTYDEMADQIAEYQQRIADGIVGDHSHTAGDYGLMTAAARHQLESPLDSEAFLSGARYQFTLWVYQSYLELKDWALWLDTICQDILQSKPEVSIECNVPQRHADPLPEYYESLVILDFTDTGGNDAPITIFSGLLKPDKLDSFTPCGPLTSGPGGTICEWNEIDTNVVPVLFDAITPECTYDPDGTPGNAWRYGCTLESGDDLFNNRNGWSWKTFSVTVDVDTGGKVQVNPTATAASATPGAARGDSLTLAFDAARFTTLADLVDIVAMDADTRLVIDRLLDESEGHGELVRRPQAQRNRRIELRLDPRRSTFGDTDSPGKGAANGRRRSRFVFTTPAGESPEIEVLFTHTELPDGTRKLGVHMDARGLDVRVPRLCEDRELQRLTELYTRFVLDDGRRPPVRFADLGRWTCSVGPDGRVRELTRIDDD
jgi:hypothetical protein